MTRLIPLGHRLLIQPDPIPRETAGGLHLADISSVPYTSGVVLNIGDGSPQDARVRSAAITRVLELVDEAERNTETKHDALALIRHEIRRYVEQAVNVSYVAVGDRVLFSAEAGQIISVTSQNELIVLDETDVLAIYDLEALCG